MHFNGMVAFGFGTRGAWSRSIGMNLVEVGVVIVGSKAIRDLRSLWYSGGSTYMSYGGLWKHTQGLKLRGLSGFEIV